jgi:hypothetical protein
MALKLANGITEQLALLVESPQVKNVPGLKEHILQTLQGGSVSDTVPKSYKGLLKAYDPCSYIYDKEHPKPKPIGLDGQPMKKPKSIAALALQTDDRLKSIFAKENKARKAASKSALTPREKAKILKTELKDPTYSAFYNATYPVKVAEYRKLYREAQMRNDCAKNKYYEFIEETLEWNLKKSKKDDLSDDEDEECTTPTSENIEAPCSDDEDEPTEEKTT